MKHVTGKKALKNITITLRDDVAEWLRIEAAKADLSMSAFIAGVLEARMGRGQDQLAALEVFLGGAGFVGIGAGLENRDALYDRPGLRRHEHTDLRAGPSRSGKASGVSGYAEADDQQPYTHPVTPKPE